MKLSPSTKDLIILGVITILIISLLFIFNNIIIWIIGIMSLLIYFYIVLSIYLIDKESEKKKNWDQYEYQHYLFWNILVKKLKKNPEYDIAYLKFHLVKQLYGPETIRKLAPYYNCWMCAKNQNNCSICRLNDFPLNKKKCRLYFELISAQNVYNHRKVIKLAKKIRDINNYKY